MIGIFDSGLGGLTAMAELRRYRPDLDIVYYADTAHLPYGTRSFENIRRLARDAVSFLTSCGADGILIACGTVSSVALEALVEDCPVPLLGVVEPAAHLAVHYTKNKTVGILATSATVESRAFEKALRRRANLVTHAIACPLFVSLVENGFTAPNDPVATPAIAHYLAPMKQSGVDTVILGCTHFPLLAAGISAYLPGVRLVGAGEAAAAALVSTHPRVGRGETQVWVSDSPASFTASATRFLGAPLPCHVKQKMTPMPKSRHIGQR